MPTVPFDSRRSSPDLPVPSETDLWMALATMKDLGRIPGAKIEPTPLEQRMDPAEGQVEDRRSDLPGSRRDWGNRGFFQEDKPYPRVFTRGDRDIKQPILEEQLGFRDIGRAHAEWRDAR